MFVTRKVFKLLSSGWRLFRFIITIITKPVHITDVEDNTQKKQKIMSSNVSVTECADLVHWEERTKWLSIILSVTSQIGHGGK